MTGESHAAPDADPGRPWLAPLLGVGSVGLGGLQALGGLALCGIALSGPAARDYAPDLVVGFERGWRVSWQTCLGGGGAQVIEDNRLNWSGDHCSVDPSLVPGILFSTIPLQSKGAGVMDVAPTSLDLFGVKPPPGWDGRSLLPR